MRIQLFLASLGLVLTAACGGPTPPPFRPVADVKVLMNAVIDPLADIVWDSVGTVVTAAGEEEKRPKNDEEWTKVHDAAVAIAESGNLLMMAPRAKGPQYGGDWMQISKSLIDAGEQAMRAADAKDTKALFSAGADIYETCTNCHSHYMQAILDVRKPAQ